jgi:hypothetical protein
MKDINESSARSYFLAEPTVKISYIQYLYIKHYLRKPNKMQQKFNKKPYFKSLNMNTNLISY